MRPFPDWGWGCLARFCAAGGPDATKAATGFWLLDPWLEPAVSGAARLGNFFGEAEARSGDLGNLVRIRMFEFAWSKT